MNQVSEKIKNNSNAFIIALTILFCSIVLAYTYKSSRTVKNTNVIIVYGSGTKDFVSDLIVWNGSFNKKNMNLKTAYEELDKDKDKIKQYLIAKGVPEKDIVFSSVDISKESEQIYDRNGAVTSKFTGYKLTQKVKIESGEVDKIEDVSRRVTELINYGIEFYSENPQYFYTKLSDLKLEMIALASADGRKRAEAIAEKSKAKLGKLKQAVTDVFQITSQYGTEAFTYGGVYNTTARNKTVTITIRLQYEVE